jgi:predicted PurR-regulated permease PerM
MADPSSSSAISRDALVVMAAIAVGATLYWLSDILTPLALATFLAAMIDGFARVLEHRLPGVSRRAALPLAVVLLLAVFAATAVFLADNAATFAGQAVGYTPKLNALIGRAAGLFGLQLSISTVLQQLDPAKYVGMIARGLQSFTSSAGFVLIYAAFIIASRSTFERKMLALFPTREERQEAAAAFLHIRDAVEKYLWVQTLTGLIVAGSSWVAMVAVGLQDAAFWAFLIFIVSYIPMIGGFIAIVAPPLFALLQFDTLWQAIVLFGVLNAICVFVGNFIYPRMQGRTANIDPIVILLALAFWTAIWGLAGALLSTPLTVVAMIFLAHFAGTRWIAVLLSADGNPADLKEVKAALPGLVSEASGAAPR